MATNCDVIIMSLIAKTGCLEFSKLFSKLNSILVEHYIVAWGSWKTRNSELRFYFILSRQDNIIWSWFHQEPLIPYLSRTFIPCLYPVRATFCITNILNDIGTILCWIKKVPIGMTYSITYRGYYKVARRYDFYLRVVQKTIFYEQAQRVSKILFLTWEDKSHIFKPPCNILFISIDSSKQKIVKFHAQKQIFEFSRDRYLH
jgi:hypothetical protein